jgi:hypothetical protein
MSAVNYGEVYGGIPRVRAGRGALELTRCKFAADRGIGRDTQTACRAAEVKAKHNLYYADSFEQGLDVHK